MLFVFSQNSKLAQYEDWKRRIMNGVPKGEQKEDKEGSKEHLKRKKPEGVEHETAGSTSKNWLLNASKSAKLAGSKKAKKIKKDKIEKAKGKGSEAAGKKKRNHEDQENIETNHLHALLGR